MVRRETSRATRISPSSGRVCSLAARGLAASLAFLSLPCLADVKNGSAYWLRGVTADRVAVRYMTPETGGMAHPRFITDRTLALFARFEAMSEQVPMPEAGYPERYVRSALDRLVARSMLAGLLRQRGTEAPDLPRRAREARAELADRVGGPRALDEAMKREGIDDDELMALLNEQIRAATYIDKAITSILTVTEDSLREAYRGAVHPYRNLKYEDARERLRVWVATERQRATELEFLQSARARITVIVHNPIGTSEPNREISPIRP